MNREEGQAVYDAYVDIGKKMKAYEREVCCAAADCTAEAHT